jgi:hypothetical protein
MKKISLITKHLVTQIENCILEKHKYLNHDGFLYLDSPIVHNNKSINRVKNGYFYYYDQILPQDFFQLDGDGLMNIYHRLKSNKFFIWKEYSGKAYKVRIKNANT